MELRFLISIQVHLFFFYFSNLKLFYSQLSHRHYIINSPSCFRYARVNVLELVFFFFQLFQWKQYKKTQSRDFPQLLKALNKHKRVKYAEIIDKSRCWFWSEVQSQLSFWWPWLRGWLHSRLQLQTKGFFFGGSGPLLRSSGSSSHLKAFHIWNFLLWSAQMFDS